MFSVAQPTTQLNATEQDTLVKQIGLALLRAAPRDWRKVSAEYRAVGRYHELTGEIVLEDGSAQEWIATHDIATLFGRLRAGMYRDGRGTWFNARYQLDHPSSYNLEYNRDEPQWHLAPPPQAYSDELRMFPRTEENVPEWLIRRMSGLGPEQPGPHFRIARIFDTIGPAGRPVINRPDLDVDEQDRLLDYLDHAPVVVQDRGYDIDRLAQTPEATVPVAFHSDGHWIWPAAVNFYLRTYGVSPEADLIEHIRANAFQLPQVDELTLQGAAAYLTRGNQTPQQRPAPGGGPGAGGPGSGGPGSGGPGVVPARVVPARAAPARVVPARAAPARAVPARAGLAQVGPARAVPVALVAPALVLRAPAAPVLAAPVPVALAARARLVGQAVEFRAALADLTVLAVRVRVHRAALAGRTASADLVPAALADSMPTELVRAAPAQPRLDSARPVSEQPRSERQADLAATTTSTRPTNSTAPIPAGPERPADRVPLVPTDAAHPTNSTAATPAGPAGRKVLTASAPPTTSAGPARPTGRKARSTRQTNSAGPAQPATRRTLSTPPTNSAGPA
ncbi:hypothetical protein A4R44_06212 [Amycolatopsis sp. M39]|nr:hypothetical protein A4R44_06212 [Amycolatopsis sp. M39]